MPPPSADEIKDVCCTQVTKKCSSNLQIFDPDREHSSAKRCKTGCSVGDAASNSAIQCDEEKDAANEATTNEFRKRKQSDECIVEGFGKRGSSGGFVLNCQSCLAFASSWPHVSIKSQSLQTKDLKPSALHFQVLWLLLHHFVTE